jgi:hypothetical protein
MVGEWTKLHKEELHNLYSSPDKIRIIRSKGITCAEHVARMGVKRECIQGFGGKGRN